MDSYNSAPDPNVKGFLHDLKDLARKLEDELSDARAATQEWKAEAQELRTQLANCREREEGAKQQIDELSVLVRNNNLFAFRTEAKEMRQEFEALGAHMASMMKGAERWQTAFRAIKAIHTEWSRGDKTPAQALDEIEREVTAVFIRLEETDDGKISPS
jgi:chromosome segregation ATPase